jgi:hypothetical protein
MATGSNEDNFDWVTAQAGCSAAAMFQTLLDGARADVDRRNGANFGRHDNWRFEFHQDGELFEVSRSGGARAAVVTFEREGPRININGDGIDVMITAVVGINSAGDCRYYVGEAEYLGWEVRRLALDQLFFEDAEE